MEIEVFNRYEFKYKIKKSVADKLIEIFRKYLHIDQYCQEHGKYRIVNRYVDTTDNQLIRKSITKPVYKHKLRIRNYHENVADTDYVFFEIKKKYKGLVNKRRCKLTNAEANYLIKNKRLEEVKEYTNKQILKEIIYILMDNDYEIKNKIVYDRIAFFDDYKNLRVSFDFDVHSQTSKLLEDGMVLMEIKTATAVPLWLVAILNENGIKKTSFSKYGLDYLLKLEGKDEYIIN